MNSDFKITSEQIEQQGKPSITVFNLRGWLDAQSEEILFSSSQEAHSKDALHLILNLEDVNMITSRGIRAFQRIQKLYTAQNANTDSTGMRLCNAQPNVYNVLKLSGFLTTLPVYESLQAALESYD